MFDSTTGCVGVMLAEVSRVASVMVFPALVLGFMGFGFGLAAFDKVTKLEERVKQLEYPDEESKDK